MLKSLHIGRYLNDAADFRVVSVFLEAIGFERMSEQSDRSIVFAAPLGLLSINALSPKYDPEVLDRLRDVNRLIVIEVNNPDAVFEIAQAKQLKLLADSVHPETGERSFSLELPGEIIVTIHGQPDTAVPGIEADLTAKGKRFAIVVARFNSLITERLLQGALDGLRRTGARPEHVTVLRVPGSFEIPSSARTLAQTKKYDAIICLGCLLRGDTAHYDVIVHEVTRGIGQSAQETGIPHAFGVLTCDTVEQAIDRAGLKMGNKGLEAALAAVEMANLKKAISSRPAVSKRRRSSKSGFPANGKNKSASKSSTRRADSSSGKSRRGEQR